MKEMVTIIIVAAMVLLTLAAIYAMFTIKEIYKIENDNKEEKHERVRR